MLRALIDPLIATITAVAAGSTAVAAYLNAKLHLRKDVDTLWALRQVEHEFARNGIVIPFSTYNLLEEQLSLMLCF